MHKLKHLFLLFTLVYAGKSVAWAQGTTVPPDCQWQDVLTASGATPLLNGYDNRFQQCETWTLAYEATGFSSFTLTFQSSVGATTPTSFGAYTGSTVESSSGFGTNTTGGIATYTNLATGTVVNTPWVRVNLASAMGTGTVRIFLYGYKTGYTGGTGGGGGGGGGSGCPNPCPVVGTAASGSVPSGNPVQTAGSDGTDIRTIRTDTTGRPIINAGIVTDLTPATQNVTAQDVASTTTAGANAQSLITGTPTAGSAASFALATGYTTARILTTGTWTGTLAVEGSPDGGTTWTTQGIHQPGTSYTTSSFTANFTGQGPASGYTNIRVRATATWTGTATVRLDQTINPASIYVAGPIKLQDATTQSIQNTIKAASTAAVAADTALVVALSPNSPAPPIAGSSTFLSGQQAVTGSAVALATNSSKTVCVKASIGNTINVYIGPTGITTSTGFELAPGQGTCQPLSNTNLVFVVASTTGASVSWAATN
jgi:hypothetical protein